MCQEGLELRRIGIGRGVGEALGNVELARLVWAGLRGGKGWARRTSFRPSRRNCSARFWRRGADGVIGSAETKANKATKAMRMKERIFAYGNDWIGGFG